MHEYEKNLIPDPVPGRVAGGVPQPFFLPLIYIYFSLPFFIYIAHEFRNYLYIQVLRVINIHFTVLEVYFW